jgi:hypothetical protein
MNQYYTRGIVWQLRIVCFASQGLREPSRGPLHRGRYTPIAGLQDAGCCAHDDGITGLLTAAGFGVRMSGPPAKRARRSIPVECGAKVKLDESRDHFICLECSHVYPTNGVGKAQIDLHYKGDGVQAEEGGSCGAAQTGSITSFFKVRSPASAAIAAPAPAPGSASSPSRRCLGGSCPVACPSFGLRLPRSSRPDSAVQLTDPMGLLVMYGGSATDARSSGRARAVVGQVKKIVLAVGTHRFAV